jgi:cell division protein FtsQ
MWDNDFLLRNIANTMLICSVIGVLYGAGYYLMNLPGAFPLRSVRLSVAPQNVAAEQVLRVLHTEVQGNLITVDIERLRHSLEQLPWVRSVNIRREFPDRLAVQLEEHQVLARWNNSGLVNRQGEVFVAESGRVMPKAAPRPDEVRVSDETTSQSTRSTYNANQVDGYGGVALAGASRTHRPPLEGGSEQVLPSFIGPEGTSAEVTHHYSEFNLQLDALDLHATQLVLSPRHAWQIRLSNGMVLELGREDVQQRLARFVAAYPYTEDRIQKTADRGAVHVDLRYRNGFAVRQNANVKG